VSMKKAFSRIAWGLALELADFRINGFDVFPDIVGYGLLLAGLGPLSSRGRGFRIAWMAAGVQFAGAAIQLLGIRIGFSLTGGEQPEVGQVALTALSTAAELALLWGIFEGIRALATVKGNAGIAGSAIAGRGVALVAGSSLLFLYPFLLNFEFHPLAAMLLLMTLGALLSSVWALLLARRAGRELSEDDGPRGGNPEIRLG